ncbi:MAG: hypothetical protein JRJ58_08555, partial [Deltaproteobacteria bacterium]|nr:hypothetical protein [Deltaproteobacteria bacterium]
MRDDAQNAQLLRVVEFRDLTQVVQRFGHALDMRPIRSEDDALYAHVFLDLVDIVLPERIDPDVLLEQLCRIFLVVVGRGESIAGLAQLPKQVGQEFGTVLDRHDAQVREALEESLIGQRDQKIVARSLDVEMLDVGRHRVAKTDAAE